MNIYYAEHELFALGSSYDLYRLVIAAETEAAALGEALNSHHDTKKKNWVITPLDCSERIAYNLDFI